MELDLSVTRIEEAARTIDTVFLNTPQYADEQLNTALARNVVVKVETANPLRSFKGRGADFFIRQVDPDSTVVCSSTGNFASCRVARWACSPLRFFRFAGSGNSSPNRGENENHQKVTNPFWTSRRVARGKKQPMFLPMRL